MEPRLWIWAYTTDTDGEVTDHGCLREGVAFSSLEEQARDVLDVARSAAAEPSVVELRIKVAL